VTNWGRCITRVAERGRGGGGGGVWRPRHEGESHLVGGDGDKACARAAFPYAEAGVSCKTQAAPLRD
jgi:hypothetical protein